MSQTLTHALVRNFLGNSPYWYKMTIVSFLLLNAILAKVYHWAMNGWPHENPGGEFKSYFKRKDEISVTDGILTWGMRVIVPRSAQENVLKTLHDTHIGMSRMKSLARSYVWWPDIDGDIEHLVLRCVNCQSNLNAPPQVPLNPWEWPAKP